MKTNFSLIFSLFLIFSMLFSGKSKDNSKPQIQTKDYYNYIAVNEILMWVSNNGDGSHDPYTDGNGFYWPGGENAKKAAVFEDGLVWGCLVNGDTVVNGNTHRQGLQAGKIGFDGLPDNPDDPRYRVYKINKNWQDLPNGPKKDALERDYNEWPVEDGAPWVDVDDDGVFTRGIDQPDFVGDEVLWFVSNDLDTNRTRRTYGSDPIGLEVQTLVWAYNESDYLKDVVFKKYVLINKGPSELDQMFLTYWTDCDLGNANDDFVGCDTLLDLGYVYNGDNEDGDGSGIQYGTSPPAVGHMLIQGPISPGTPNDSAKFKDTWITGYKNLPLSSFFLLISPNVFFKDPSMGTPSDFYYNMNGLIWNGNPVTDPQTGLETKFCLPGDPVIGEGWYEGSGWPGGEHPDDRRYLMTTGPITMAPGDTQEVVIAIFMGQGDNHIDSITELKETALDIHRFTDNQISDYWIAGDFECMVEKSFLKARTDSMYLRVTFPNPDNHDYTITAIIKSLDNLYVDSLMLFDDGNHHDQYADDGIWGNMIGPINAEKEFTISMIASDLNTGINYRSTELTRFYTIGPIIVDHFEITSEDTFANPGDRLVFLLTLKNEGFITAVPNISTQLMAIDSCATPAAIAFYPEYGTIDPGETVASGHGQSIIFSTECADSTWTSLRVDIYTDDKLWWKDTISVFVSGPPSSSNEDVETLPKEFALKQNYPNPFNPGTMINYQLPMTNDVVLSIYNLLGQKVATLVSGRQAAGYYQVEWNASGFASGIYYYRLIAGEFFEMKKMVILR